MTAVSKGSQWLLFCAHKEIVFSVYELWPPPMPIRSPLFRSAHLYEELPLQTIPRTSYRASNPLY
jgi:hypothetical protein